ncbi:DUF3618 domain-containing protein [Sphingomonadales bacterium 56]|uniref:DUF3618 domain-containing protein n=1 Tax=unclassified Sphingobium TaxID=2611147 RepID=UPI00191B00AC|nr:MULTISPECIES: DUF3618 domain-containing protein [unclassified Sphingobium]MBY2929679.1 DUF3618 domain-containing protein [Sphingomonadales bacterium 56]MBY2960138.1 DUF3618 domain-containing protein [Sphingomonadales bacterium 58]CAD7339977.1 hypothetical protein SPHS6_02718 [Sphingobium sp. S6]CAD7340447.1 hypothetical protein SPHS8_03115 [Sphingobium sp. S8]
MTDTLERDPDAIERDIRRTQEDMSRTIDKIGDQLTPRKIFDALLDKADENNVDARMLLDGARRNPIALGLIAAGTIWLISDKDSKFPSLPSRSGGREQQPHDLDVHHRDYVSHMSAVEMRDGEDFAAYQRRRDQARANYLMLERRADEDDSSFRQRLDELTDRFREKRHAWAESSSRAGQATARGASQAASRAQDLYESNPLVGGLIAAAVGAALGSALPISRVEQEKLGSLGEKARTMASEQKQGLTDTLREKKDDLVGRVDDKLQQGDNTGNQPGNQSTGDAFHAQHDQGSARDFGAPKI